MKQLSWDCVVSETLYEGYSMLIVFLAVEIILAWP